MIAYHRRTAIAAPRTPAPTLATFLAPSLGLADVLADEDEAALADVGVDFEVADVPADEVTEAAVVVPVDSTVAAEEEAVEDAEEETAVEAQDTADGRPVTPEMAQNCWAKLVADCWSAASHFPARQHAISLRKDALEQMHLMSVPEQPPIFVPVVN